MKAQCKLSFAIGPTLHMQAILRVMSRLGLEGDNPTILGADYP